MIDFTSLNYLAILVAVIINQALGAMWYSVLFGKTWMAEVGIKPEDISKKEAGKSMVLAILLAIVGYLVLALFIQAIGGDNWITGTLTGLGLGFFSLLLTGTNYAYEGKGIKLFLINVFYPILAYTIGGTIIGFW